MRYIEFVLVGSGPVNGELKGTCYHTAEFHLKPGSLDFCPREFMDKRHTEGRWFDVERIDLTISDQ